MRIVECLAEQPDEPATGPLSNGKSSPLMGGHKMSWLTRPLTCDGTTVLGPLNQTRLCDADLKEICLRMHAILHTIEMPRCEGRLLPLQIFDRMDALESAVLHGPQPRLSDWSDLISEIGEYYGLAGTGPIPVDSAEFNKLRERYSAGTP